MSITVATLCGLLLRWLVGLGPYSGEGKAPMFGDYEAQRHWQEITINLPVEEWYRNSSDNNLLYWGLDYPPLTAYHSWLCGKVAEKINTSWVELHGSRGVESYEHKFFMRITVLVADLLVFLPALIFFIKKQRNINNDRSETILLTFLYPGLMLIDYGHFQYNNVSLGFFVFAITCFMKKSSLLGAIFFCLALNYKQMELYHALPVFFYLLGVSFKKNVMEGVQHVLLLGITVIATFSICWYPFLNHTAIDVLQRLFPTGRGLYEDKVANVWCALSPIIKIKEVLMQQQILMLCAGTTLIMSLPSCIMLLWKPTINWFKYACVSCSLAFYLFSFQVHEKSILIPALSACLLFNESPTMVFQFLQLSCFSMFPLLSKEGLTMQYFATKYIFTIAAFYYFNVLAVNKTDLKFFKSYTLGLLSQKNCRKIFIVKVLFTTLITDAITVCSLFIDPPSNLPDLWPVIISTLSCLGFIKCYIYFTTLPFSIPPPKIKSS